jgi:hypothetical protein
VVAETSTSSSVGVVVGIGIAVAAEGDEDDANVNEMYKPSIDLNGGLKNAPKQQKAKSFLTLPQKTKE